MPDFVFNGMRLHYVERGTGPLVVLLPGNTASSAHMTGDVEHLARGYRVVALDLPGTGRSDRMAVWPDDWWGLGAEAAAALIVHLGEPSAIAIGISGGGVIALLMAIRFPALVRAVVADSCLDRRDPDRWRWVVAGRVSRTPGMIAFWQQGHGVDWEQVVDADTDAILRFADAGGDWFHGQYARITCPTLLTASMTDTLVPEVIDRQLAMARTIPGCCLFHVNGGDHPLMWSRPELFYGAVFAFLATL
ncbi:MAG: alpha/beta hydrolase [Anaerolineae bacterium]|nr:alpha/beta hydrolase [Anaerolineae bacterium]